MSFFEHTNLKMRVSKIWGHIQTTPMYDSSVCQKESHMCNLPIYELILMGPCNRILHYNGVSAHIIKPSIVFLPHFSTDIVNPPIKEYMSDFLLMLLHLNCRFRQTRYLQRILHNIPCHLPF